MSRERPVEPPRVIPDAQRGVRLERSGKGLSKRELAHLASFSGAAFMGWLSAPFHGGKVPRAPTFIRRGYEASILDNLQDFYAQRPRPWRLKSCDSCKPTFKERLKMRRRRMNGHAA
jgi:hypothetical protein